MTMSHHRSLGILVLSAALLGAMAVAADANAAKKKGKKSAGETTATDSSQKAARDHYAKGKAFYDEGNFAASLVEFNAAYTAKPHPTVLKSIAECQVQTGDILGAVATLEKYLADPQTEETESVELRLGELRKTPVKTAFTSVPDNAKITVDGKDMELRTPAEADIVPGDHTVVFTVDGYEPLTKPLTVTLGEESQLGADFASEGTVLPAAPEPTIVDPFVGEAEPLSPAPEVKDESGLPAAFWAMVAVTGVGVISGTVFGTMALSMQSDYESAPTQAKKEAGQRDAIIADVSFGVAAAAAIAGTVLLVVHSKKGKSGESARLNITPTAGPENVGFSASVTF